MRVNSFCAPVGFDIVRQTYTCANCGELTGIQETKEVVFRWRTLQKQNHAVNPEGLILEEYFCPACGAQIVFERGEASETCDFCGNNLIRKELTEAERMPELIIPFLSPQKKQRKGNKRCFTLKTIEIDFSMVCFASG